MDVEQTEVWITFWNVEQWFTPGTYLCRRHRLTATVQWPQPFSAAPMVWTRSSGSMGWRKLGDTQYELFDYEKEVYEGGVVPGSVSPTGATLETYVYEVYYGGAWHWWPADPSHARLTMTAVGAPATTDVGRATRPAVTELLTIPNPARSGIAFEVGVPERGLVRVVVLDAQGRLVSVVRNEMMEPGRKKLAWNGRLADGQRAAPGVYFCQIRGSSGQAVRRFVLLGSAGE